MIITRKEIEDKFTQAFNNSKKKFNKDEIKLSIKYHLNEINIENKTAEYKKLVEIYNKNILNYQKQFVEEREKVSKLITFISIFNTKLEDELEELPFIKTLRIFENIDTLYCLYTEESIKKYEEIIKFFSSPYQGRRIEVKGEKIDSENITKMHQYLKSLTVYEEVFKDNTILDSTLGLKMTGIAMYKLAVEYGIKTITWRDFQMPCYEQIENKNEYKIKSAPSKRLPLLVELKVMQEPTNENIRIYQTINNEISKFNFLVVANCYKNMGIEDYYFFYKTLSDLINLGNILELSPNKFYKKVTIFLDKIFEYNYLEKSIIEKIRDIIVKLVVLVDYKNIQSTQIKITRKDIEDEKKKQKSLGLHTQKMKDKLFYSLVLIYLSSNMNLNLLNSSLYKPLFKIIFNASSTEKDLDIDEYLEILFENNKNYDEIIEYLAFSEILKEEQNSLIRLKEHTLYLDKFDIIVDLENEVKKFFKKNGTPYKSAIPILKLISNVDNSREYDLVDLEFNKEWCSLKFDQYKSSLKLNLIPTLNSIIKEKLKNNGLPEEDFILLIDEFGGKSRKYLIFNKIKINDIFLN